MGGQNTKNYHELGGERTVVGGSLDVVSGGDLDIESGGALKIAGTPVTAGAAEVNQLTGAGALKADFQKLHGVTATAVQLNRTAVSTAGLVEASKVAVLGANKELNEVHAEALYVGAGAGTQVTATAAQLNRTAVTTAGVAEASKVAVLGTSKDIDELDVATSFKLGGTEVTATAAQLNRTAVTTVGIAEASKVAVLGASKDIDELDVGSLKLSGVGVTALDGRPLSCSFTVSSPIGAGKFVDIQLLDYLGADLTERGSAFGYLSEDDEGGTLSTVALSTGIAIGTDGVIIEVLSKKAFQLVSEADGDIDLAITHNDTANLWLALVLPTGQLAVSATIAFTGA